MAWLQQKMYINFYQHKKLDGTEETSGNIKPEEAGGGWSHGALVGGVMQPDVWNYIHIISRHAYRGGGCDLQLRSV